MEVVMAVLAQGFEVQDGLPNIFGVFSRIVPEFLPIMSQPMTLVVNYQASAAESGMAKTFGILLMDEDGTHLTRFEHTGVVDPPDRPGRRIEWTNHYNFPPMKFDKPGDYAFSILVDGDEKRSVSLYVDLPNS